MNLSRNIVIEASAGTGKTYTLVQTILQALFEKNLPMEALVAMTFTKKAAGEMKERIAAELHKVLDANTVEEARPAAEAMAGSLDQLKDRARKALETIDRAAIGTIHSYAFSLLKRFPMAAGINPGAEVDEKGIHADDLFEMEWPLWLRSQLSTQDSPPPNHRRVRQDVVAETPGTKDWLEVLERITLGDVRALARRLCDFDVPLECLPLKGEGENRTLALLTKLLKPFAARFRAKILAEGFLSIDALLVLARDLVARDVRVREILKRQIRLIFVDEFQDTDPLQGEMILFLAEAPGVQAKTWDKVKLEPGKLFIVGDPKQSIYRFRGADISAYKRITELALEQGGERLSLDESYRSHDQIIHVVNAAFSSLMQEKHPISPPYQALQPRRKKDADHQDVELRLAASDEPQSSDDALNKEAKDAAAWIAANVTPHPNPLPQGERGFCFRDIALIFRSTPAMTPFIEELRRRSIPFVVEAERYFYRTPEVTDVLNLLRALEDPRDHIALAGFLRSPLGGFTDKEVVTIKQAGWGPLSSPPRKRGSRQGIALDSRPPHDRAGFRGNDGKNHTAKIFELVKGLQKRVKREPLKSILNHVYEDTYLMELAARSYHKDQTMANLLKLKRLTESFAEEGETTLSGLLRKIDRFMEDDRLEGEYPLADETYDAVRLLTVHKAKGLEFPVVWLPGLHRGRRGNAGGKKLSLHYDWSTGRVGLAIGKELKSLDCGALDEDVKAREAAEELRVLYVAMTRAKERLILSGGIHLKRPNKNSFLDQLAGAWKLDLEEIEAGILKIGESTMTISRIESILDHQPLPRPAVSWLDTLKPAEIAKTWRQREAVYEQGMETKLTITPTSKGRDNVAGGHVSEGPSLPRYHAATPSPVLLGTLIHRFLESWDFTCEKCDMPAKLRRVANSYFAGLGLLKEPFPDPKEGDKTENPPDLVETVEEAQRLLADFIGSEVWEEIKNSEIIGREVPFFYQVKGAVMRGFMDILYRTPDGALVIGDFKTDKEYDEKRYTEQAKAYQQAIQLALGEKAEFKLIYLRDSAVE